MVDFIEKYLIKNKYCAIPQLGLLKLEKTSAQISVADNLIVSPKTIVVFFLNEKETNQHFIQLFSAEKNIELTEAEKELENFIQQIVHLNGSETKQLNQIGYFFKTEQGIIDFKQNDVINQFNEILVAKRVIHPNQKHSVLVGDEEKSNVFMSDYLNKNNKVSINKWWVILLIILIAVSIIVMNTKHIIAFVNNLQ